MRSVIFLWTHYSGNEIKVDEVEGHVARMGKSRQACRVIMGKSERRRRLG
jgi:hypothetical protein